MSRSLTIRIHSALIAALVVAGLAAAPTSAAQDDVWSLSGSGWGHGVGMSQYGAWQMAVDGATAPEILKHYYTGTTYDRVPDTAAISVNLLNDVRSATMRTSALADGGGAVSVQSGTTTMTGGEGDRIIASAGRDGGVTVECEDCAPVTSITGPEITVSWDDGGTLLSVGDKRYRDGKISVTRSRSGATINVVAQVRVHDEYLDYIAEVPWTWHAEALKAQAAAARGYALAARAGGIRADCACHVYDTTTSQVFGGYPSEASLPYWPRWTAAVRAAGSGTEGYVVRHNGKIISALYSSSSGGRTQNNEDVWAGAPLPYLRSVDDHWSLRSANPRSAWTVRTSGADLSKAFGLPDVARLDLTNRHVSGAVDRAVATAANGRQATVTGRALASALGLNSSYIARHASRLGGADRYATAAQVAKSLPQTATAVVIAGGEPRSLVDATVGGPLAGAVGAPILLSRQGTLPGPTLSELDRRGDVIKTAYVLGGEAAVSPAVVRTLRDRGLTVVRIGGATRFETARLVADEIGRHRPVTSVVLAAGDALVDVVSASGPSAALGQPVLLTTPTRLHPGAAASLTAIKPSRAYLAGGWITGAAETAIRDTVPSVIRVSGVDRYATATALAATFAPQIGDYESVVVSSGEDANLVDSISAGALQKPMILVRPTALPASVRDAIQRLPGAGRVIAVGGTSAVSDAVLMSLRRS